MRRTDAIAALVIYAVLLAAAWIFASHSEFVAILGHAFGPVFVSFALILAPVIWFGFGAADWLRAHLRSRAARIIAPGVFIIPYLISATAIHDLDWRVAATFCFLPITLAIVLEYSPDWDTLHWQDLLVLAALGLLVVFHLLGRGWSQGGFPKLLLTDVALYLYLVVRPLPRVGYDFHPQLSDLVIGAREWILFAPIAIGLGLALGFLHWHAILPHPAQIVGGLAFTLVFIAVPEELFFRGLLLNLLETRLRPLASLLLSAALFGLSHFNKGAAFNWRYVLLAALAGAFYGRAWRNRHRVLTAAITHTLVDVTWSLWFR